MPMRKNPVKRYLHPLGPDNQVFNLTFQLEQQHRLTSDSMSVPVWDQHVWATVADPNAMLVQAGEFVGQQLAVTVEPSVSFAKGQVQWAIVDVPAVPPVLKRSSQAGQGSVDTVSQASSSLRLPPSPESVVSATGSRKILLQSRAAPRLPPSPDQPVRTSVSSNGSRGTETSDRDQAGVRMKIPTPTTGQVQKCRALLYRMAGQELFFMLIKGAPGNTIHDKQSKLEMGGICVWKC